MIEPIMYIGIGFLVAGLLVIGVIPLVHARAVRLTMRRLDALNPVSRAEIQADKDQLRAQFAMSTRRLEMSIEQLKARTTSQAAEIGKKTEAVSRLKFELGAKAAARLALEAKETQLSDELAAVSADRAAKMGALEQAERALAAAQAELARLHAVFQASAVAAEGQRVELLAERAQIEALKGQIHAYQKETEELRGRLSIREPEIELLHQQLAEERASARDLERVENTVLREQINEVAAEIARLTGTLEGAESPIGSILKGDRSAAAPSGTKGGAARAPAGAKASETASTAEAKGTLTERMRALQGRVTRAAQRSRA
jgi:chromosome segregation ATPase